MIPTEYFNNNIENDKIRILIQQLSLEFFRQIEKVVAELSIDFLYKKAGEQTFLSLLEKGMADNSMLNNIVSLQGLESDSILKKTGELDMLLKIDNAVCLVVEAKWYPERHDLPSFTSKWEGKLLGDYYVRNLRQAYSYTYDEYIFDKFKEIHLCNINFSTVVFSETKYLETWCEYRPKQGEFYFFKSYAGKICPIGIAMYGISIPKQEFISFESINPFL